MAAGDGRSARSLTRPGADGARVAGHGPVVDERYTVLLLDELQLDRFLRRPSMRSVDRKAGRTIDVWPIVRSRRTWAAGGIVGALAVWAMVWLGASGGHAVESAPSPTVADLAPTVSTGASFNVTVASFVKDRDARSLASRLESLSLPAFAWRIDGTKREVLVGPFVSIDEAETTQRALAGHGYRQTQLYVDERLRSTATMPASFQAAVAASNGINPAVLLVAAPGRLSLVFELSEEPRRVSGLRVSGTSFEVSAGPLMSPVAAQRWSAPADIQLVRQVAVDATGAASLDLHARLLVSETAHAAVRVLGRRVYVDVSRAQEGIEDMPPMPAPVGVDGVTATAAPARSKPSGPGVPISPAVPSAQQYRQAIGPVLARFEQIQPFLRSAVASPTPEVLAALGGTFGELEESVRATNAPPESLASHGLLASAVQLAKSAVAPDFSGDRVARVREAAAQFAAAKGRLRN